MMGHGHNIVEQTRSELVLKLQDVEIFRSSLHKDYGQILIFILLRHLFRGMVLVAYSEMIDKMTTSK